MKFLFLISSFFWFWIFNPTPPDAALVKVEARYRCSCMKKYIKVAKQVARRNKRREREAKKAGKTKWRRTRPDFEVVECCKDKRSREAAVVIAAMTEQEREALNEAIQQRVAKKCGGRLKKYKKWKQWRR